MAERSCPPVLSPTRDGPLSARAFLLLTPALLTLLLLAIWLLPQDRSLRFHQAHELAVVKAGWIYDRTHFDPTPIDVVFVGTSHTVFGVDSAEIERAYEAMSHRPIHVVNFGLQHLGRDMQYLLGREAILNKDVKLLVIEITPEEPRTLHPATFLLADATDLVRAPMLVNVNYFSNLARLPERQISLAAEMLAAKLTGSANEARLTGHRGPHWDDTYAEAGSSEDPAVKPEPRTRSHSEAELEAQRQHWLRLNGSRRRVPEPLQSLMTRPNRLYVRELVELAEERHIPVRFLFLPSYKQVPNATEARRLDRLGPTWKAPDVLKRTELWLDVNHLNYAGLRWRAGAVGLAR